MCSQASEIWVRLDVLSSVLVRRMPLYISINMSLIILIWFFYHTVDSIIAKNWFLFFLILKFKNIISKCFYLDVWTRGILNSSGALEFLNWRVFKKKKKSIYTKKYCLNKTGWGSVDKGVKVQNWRGWFFFFKELRKLGFEAPGWRILHKTEGNGRRLHVRRRCLNRSKFMFCSRLYRV